MLDVSDIHLLKTIVESGSINKAAEKLFMSQPTLTKKLARLEQSLKVELFHRHSTGMTATDITHYLINQGQGIQRKLDHMVRHVELLSNLEGGSINIGVSPIIEQLYFPKVLLDLVEETKNVQVSFKVESPDKLHQTLLDGEIDIAIGPISDQQALAELTAMKLTHADVIFVVRAGHPLTHRKTPIAFQELTRYSGIGPTLNQTLDIQIEENAPNAKLQVVCDNYRISKSVVLSSDYFTGGPKQLFEKEISSGELVIITVDISIPWQAYAYTRPETAQTPVISKLLSILDRYVDQ